MKPDLSTVAGRLQLAIDRNKSNANKIEVDTGGEITRQAVRLILKGVTLKPTWDKLLLLANNLGVRPHWLASGEEPMLPTPTLKDEEVELIQHFRHLSPTHKQDLRDLAERWADQDGEGPGQRPAPAIRPPRRHQ
jgi:transcriptional regulator with XRE-family HTH domain